MAIESAQQRNRLLRRLPRQTPRNDKRGYHCGELKPRVEGRGKRSNLITLRCFEQ